MVHQENFEFRAGSRRPGLHRPGRHIKNIGNFGVFEVVERKPRVGRNPNSPSKTVQIPERKVVKFKPGKVMRETVLKLSK